MGTPPGGDGSIAGFGLVKVTLLVTRSAYVPVMSQTHFCPVAVVTCLRPAPHVHVYEPGVLTQAPAPQGFVPEHSLTSVQPLVPLPLPVYPFGQVHVTSPAVEVGSSHVAIDAQGPGTAAHSSVLGAHVPPEVTTFGG